METNHKEFKPFDKVLVRGHNPIWKPDLYAYWDESINTHQVIGFGNVLDGYILPYEGNEHLVGTTDEPDEEVKLEKGEYIVCFQNRSIETKDLSRGNIRQFCHIVSPGIVTTAGIAFYKYFIRFSDFNPNDMEETKKHILCVKNGKIVKYKLE